MWAWAGALGVAGRTRGICWGRRGHLGTPAAVSGTPAAVSPCKFRLGDTAITKKKKKNPSKQSLVKEKSAKLCQKYDH